MAAECVWPWPLQLGVAQPILVDEEKIARRVVELMKEEGLVLKVTKEPA